jgi:glycosyltransferase involved in cell wall biosynthesis
VTPEGLALDVPIVVLASAPWETPAPVNAHQIARRMAGRGHRVLFVESTGLRTPSLARSVQDRRRVLGRLRGFLRGAREAEPRLWVLSPLALPAGVGGAARRLSDRWLAAAVSGAMRRAGIARPVVWAFLPTALPVARRLRARALVYHCVDHYAANPGVDAQRVEAAERQMLAAADLVLASSPALAERLGRERSDVVLAPNVADVELFSRAVRETLPEPPELAGVPRPRAIYAGNLAAYRVDFELLCALADRLPDVAFVLVGAAGLGDVGGMVASWESLRARRNVYARGPRPQAELPAWLRHADVALIPFLDNPHTRASLPLKLWEYVAAGLPVVATALPQFRDLAAEGVVRAAENPEAFAAAIRAALAEGGARRAERASRAWAHDWSARVDELARRVARLPGIEGVVR